MAHCKFLLKITITWNFRHWISNIWKCIYKYAAFTEEERIKCILLIQIYLTSYLILFLNSLYILHLTDSNSNPTAIKDIFIFSALTMFVVKLTLLLCSTASPKSVTRHCPFPAATNTVSLHVEGGYRANFHLGPKLHPCPVGTRRSLRTFQPKSFYDFIILYLAVIALPRKWGQCCWINSIQNILRFEILCSRGGLTHAKDFFFFFNNCCGTMECVCDWGIPALLQT